LFSFESPDIHNIPRESPSRFILLLSWVFGALYSAHTEKGHRFLSDISLGEHGSGICFGHLGSGLDGDLREESDLSTISIQVQREAFKGEWKIDMA